MCNVCAAGDALSKMNGRETDGYGMRATGGAEFSPAKYQIRKVGDPWPEHWADTTDLASTAGAMGFDDRAPNSKVRALRAAIARSLKKGRLYAIYPRLELCHRRLIWDDFWSDPLAGIRTWWRDRGKVRQCAPAPTGPDKGVPA